MESNGDERDLECIDPEKGRLPPSAKRLAGFPGLLDIFLLFNLNKKGLPAIKLETRQL